MGAKIRVIIIICILSVSLLFSLHPMEKISADGYDPELQEEYLYLHGDPGNATLNTSTWEIEEQHVLTTTAQDIPSVPIFLGEWETKPIEYPMIIEGGVWFLLYATGNLAQVSFTAALTVNDVVVSPDMETDTWTLNESTPTIFISNTVNLTQPLELNTTDIVGFRLSLVHTDPTYYNPISGGKNVTLLFGGYSYQTLVAITTDSLKIVEVTGEDDPGSSDMIVTAIVKCSFGVEDFYDASAKSSYGSFSNENVSFLDNATVIITWDWDYSVTEGGSYEVRILVYDQNYLRWEREEDIHITTPETEIDFSITSSDITFTEDPKKDQNTTIFAKITGSGKRWSTYQVEIVFYDGSSKIESKKASISKGGTNEVSVLWVPDSTGTHTIKVKIDPDNDFDETSESNNEATVEISVTEGSESKESPGFEGLFLIAAFLIALIISIRIRKKH
jgi:hypothetical protein